MLNFVQKACVYAIAGAMTACGGGGPADLPGVATDVAALSAPTAVATSVATAWTALSTSHMLAAFAGGSDTVAAWVFHGGAEFPGAQGALTSVGTPTGTGIRLSYDVGCASASIVGPYTSSSCGRYVAAYKRIYSNVAISGSAPVIAMDVRHPSSSAEVGLRIVDATGQVLQYAVPTRTLENADGTAWRRVQVRLDRPKSYWGGANNGRPQTSIKEVWITAGDPYFKAPSGYVEVDNISLSTSGDSFYTLGSSTPISGKTFSASYVGRLAVATHVVNASLLDKAKAAGIEVVRMDLLWPLVEHGGVFNFAEIDRRMALIESKGMSVVWILGYGHPDHGGVHKPVAAVDRAAYVEFARQVASRYRGRKSIKGFEIWNEPNQFGWTGEPQAYVAMARDAANAIKQADPAATVISGGLSWVDKSYLFSMAATRAMGSFSAIGIHPYRHTSRPESYAADFRPVSDILKNFGITAPVWGTEWGYSSAAFGSTYGNGRATAARNRHAIYTLRAVLTQIALDAPLATIYNLMDTGTNPDDPEQNYGLLDAAGQDKPAMVALRTLREFSKDRTFRGFVTGVPPGMHLLRWDSASESTYAAWVDGAESKVVIDAPTATVAQRWDRVAVSPRSLELTEDTGVVFFKVPR